jgi:membrane protein YqaA with SNARE-associated domain
MDQLAHFAAAVVAGISGGIAYYAVGSLLLERRQRRHTSNANVAVSKQALGATEHDEIVERLARALKEQR